MHKCYGNLKWTDIRHEYFSSFTRPCPTFSILCVVFHMSLPQRYIQYIIHTPANRLFIIQMVDVVGMLIMTWRNVLEPVFICHKRSDNKRYYILERYYYMMTYIIKWKPFPRYWPFMWGIRRSSVNSPHKGQWRGALMFSLICTWTNEWVSNRGAVDLIRHRAHYDVAVMIHWARVISQLKRNISLTLTVMKF